MLAELVSESFELQIVGSYKIEIKYSVVLKYSLYLYGLGATTLYETIDRSERLVYPRDDSTKLFRIKYFTSKVSSGNEDEYNIVPEKKWRLDGLYVHWTPLE